MKKKDHIANAAGVIPKTRIWAYKLIALSLPFIFLALVEIILRIAGYGNDYSLFIEPADHPGYLQMNPKIGEKYFTQQGNATIGDQELFRAQKDSVTYRVFVLGASSAIGYPYMHNGSFHRWLKFRLMHAYPEKNFEIINLSLTAVNSNTLYDFAHQLVKYEPDAVLIYEGHNEYYGALGVASTSNIAKNPYVVRVVIRLRQLRLVQWLTRVYATIKTLFTHSAVDERENLMKRMVAEQEIPYGSKIFQEGINQFRINLHDMLKIFADHHLPVYIGTLVSNEKDLPPFISKQSDSTHATAFREAFANGMDALQKKDSALATKDLQKAMLADSTYALCNYDLGRIDYSKGNYIQAKHYFIAAREYDALRFRAPLVINTIIRQEASPFSNVHVVDVAAEFELHSPHGIIGSETILEHLHPNLYGYALMSDAYYLSMVQNGLLQRPPSLDISFEELLKQMPVTKMDSLHGAYEIMMLKEGWPFNDSMPAEQRIPRTIEEQVAGAYSVKQINWATAMNSLFKHYVQENQIAEALVIAKGLQLEYPYEPKFYVQCGDIAMNLANYKEAVFYFGHGFQLSNNFDCASRLVICYLKMDEPEKAMAYFGYLKVNNLSQVNYTDLESLVGDVIDLKHRYEADTANVQLSNALARAYLKFANTTAAEKYALHSLNLDPKNQETQLIRARIQNIRSGK